MYDVYFVSERRLEGLLGLVVNLCSFGTTSFASFASYKRHSLQTVCRALPQCANSYFVMNTSTNVHSARRSRYYQFEYTVRGVLDTVLPHTIALFTSLCEPPRLNGIASELTALNSIDSLAKVARAPFQYAVFGARADENGYEVQVTGYLVLHTATHAATYVHTHFHSHDRARTMHALAVTPLAVNCRNTHFAQLVRAFARQAAAVHEYGTLPVLGSGTRGGAPSGATVGAEKVRASPSTPFPPEDVCTALADRDARIARLEERTTQLEHALTSARAHSALEEARCAQLSARVQTLERELAYDAATGRTERVRALNAHLQLVITNLEYLKNRTDVLWRTCAETKQCTHTLWDEDHVPRVKAHARASRARYDVFAAPDLRNPSGEVCDGTRGDTLGDTLGDQSGAEAATLEVDEDTRAVKKRALAATEVFYGHDACAPKVQSIQCAAVANVTGARTLVDTHVHRRKDLVAADMSGYDTSTDSDDGDAEITVAHLLPACKKRIGSPP